MENDERFESISDFKQALIWGREIEFEWNGIRYAAFHEGKDDKTFFLCEAYKDNDGVYFASAENMLDFIIDGQKLRDIVTDVFVWSRNI